ncbi:MAG: DEAD/DEAH box helicase, partial [Burkholderiales bacterium]
MNDATDRGRPAASRVRPRQWLAGRGWKPFAFQREVWDAIGHGESGLIHATTGTGKTYAVWLGALAAFDARPAKIAPPLTVLWITPMRALAADTTRALSEPIDELQLGWTIGVRSGDTSSAERARQTKRLPTTLVTTPESLTLLLTQPDWPERFATVRLVVVDEWHELIGNKRGVQMQLALARLRTGRSQLATWGLSATLGNTEFALEVLVGAPAVGRLVRGDVAKSVVIDTLIPPTMARFPWAGHLGTNLVREVAAEIDTVATTLVFTNTRSQAELWYQALLEARPEWAGLLALHHGSLDRTVRDWVERGLKAGTLKAVVCTSSLDLGVDFLPVERVLQLGSPKGIARLLQRAGRSGHAPGRVSRVTCVPT